MSGTFEASIKAGVLRDLIVAVLGVTEAVYLRCKEDGISISAISPARVAHVSVTLDRKAFVSYERSEDLVIGVSVGKIKEILSLALPDDIIGLKMVTEGNLGLSLGNVRRRIRTMRTDVFDEPGVPPLELSTHFELSTADFMAALKSVESVSDTVIFETRGGEVFVRGASGLDEVEARFEGASGPDARSMYSFDYLWKLAKCITGRRTLFEFSGKFPLRMSFDFADGLGRAVFFISPLLEV